MHSGQKKHTSILIFGAGNAGTNAYQHLREKFNVIGFVDNASVKQGKSLCTLPIYSPSQLKQLVFDELFIASEFFEKIKKQLIQTHGIPEQKINVLPSFMLAPIQLGESDKVQNVALSILFAICKAFKKADIPYFIDAGTLLGLYRDGELIPWDDDLDLAVQSEELHNAKLVLYHVLPELTQLSGGEWSLTEHQADKSFGAIKPGYVRCFKLSSAGASVPSPMVDVFIKYIDGENMDYTLASRGIRVPAKHMIDLQELVLDRGVLSIPSDPEGYLECYYGDWRTPVKNWDLSMLKAAKTHD